MRFRRRSQRSCRAEQDGSFPIFAHEDGGPPVHSNPKRSSSLLLQFKKLQCSSSNRAGTDDDDDNTFTASNNNNHPNLRSNAPAVAVTPEATAASSDRVLWIEESLSWTLQEEPVAVPGGATPTLSPLPLLESPTANEKSLINNINDSIDRNLSSSYSSSNMDDDSTVSSGLCLEDSTSLSLESYPSSPERMGIHPFCVPQKIREDATSVEESAASRVNDDVLLKSQTTVVVGTAAPKRVTFHTHVQELQAPPVLSGDSTADSLPAESSMESASSSAPLAVDWSTDESLAMDSSLPIDLSMDSQVADASANSLNIEGPSMESLVKGASVDSLVAAPSTESSKAEPSIDSLAIGPSIDSSFDSHIFGAVTDSYEETNGTEDRDERILQKLGLSHGKTDDSGDWGDTLHHETPIPAGPSIYSSGLSYSNSSIGAAPSNSSLEEDRILLTKSSASSRMQALIGRFERHDVSQETAVPVPSPKKESPREKRQDVTRSIESLSSFSGSANVAEFAPTQRAPSPGLHSFFWRSHPRVDPTAAASTTKSETSSLTKGSSRYDPLLVDTSASTDADDDYNVYVDSAPATRKSSRFEHSSTKSPKQADYQQQSSQPHGLETTPSMERRFL